MRGLPKEWFKGLDMETQVTAISTYNKKINKYKVKCGS